MVEEMVKFESIYSVCVYACVCVCILYAYCIYSMLYTYYIYNIYIHI